MQRQLPDNQRCSKVSRAPMIAASWRHYSQNEQDSPFEALDRLKKDGTIIIKQADNGGAFVVMDKTYYISKMKEHLDDKNAYKKLTRNEDKHILKGVKKNSHTETLSVWKEENWLLNKFESKTSYFCGLPKIHQS